MVGHAMENADPVPTFDARRKARPNGAWRLQTLLKFLRIATGAAEADLFGAERFTAIGPKASPHPQLQCAIEGAELCEGSRVAAKIR